MLLAGDQEGAIDYTSRIVGDDPDPDPEARMELAIMLLSAGRDDDALSQVNQILLEQPARMDALRLMAIINFRLDNLDVAWADFEDVLASGHYTMDALYYLGRIADRRSDHEQAVRLTTGERPTGSARQDR
jgi:tetratricopeptide (TPR) repeat protein